MKYKKITLIFALMALSIGLYVSDALIKETVNAEEIMVYKSPTCGCCKKWVKHLQDEGFTVKTKDIANLIPVKKQFGVNPEFLVIPVLHADMGR